MSPLRNSSAKRFAIVIESSIRRSILLSLSQRIAGPTTASAAVAHLLESATTLF
jgi:hypothetical protein